MPELGSERQRCTAQSILLFPLPVVVALASSCSKPPTSMPAIACPQTKRVDVLENHFGPRISDPYRWLENDVRSDKEVAASVESQNKVSNA